MTQASRRRRCEYVRRDGAENEGVWRSLSSSRPHARGGWRRPWRRRQVERGPTSVSLRLLRSRSCCWCEERARRQRGWPGDVVSVRVRGARRARSGVAWHVWTRRVLVLVAFLLARDLVQRDQQEQGSLKDMMMWPGVERKRSWHGGVTLGSAWPCSGHPRHGKVVQALGIVSWVIEGVSDDMGWRV
jgi:hypothetical protein